MADLYLKALESERKSLWAACRLKGLPKHSPERLRIAEIDKHLRAQSKEERLRSGLLVRFQRQSISLTAWQTRFCGVNPSHCCAPEPAPPRLENQLPSVGE